MASERAAGRPRAGRLRAKAWLALPLLLAACTGPLPPPPGAAPPVPDPGTTGAAAPAPADPVPQPQDPPPAGTEPQATTSPAAGNDPTTGAPPAPAAPEGLAVPGPGRAPATPAAGTAPPPPASSPAAPGTVTAYYVLLDDGGSNGVRFGCNDSLVGMDRAVPETGEPLPAAIGALLEDGHGILPADGASGPEVYNALAGSSLKFLSGTFDGTTVTVYLAGTLSLAGVCDAPRVEAQLTQTAVAAVGAIRAEIYVNGTHLTEALRLD